MKKPRLIKNWRQSWRMSSVRTAALLAIVSAIQLDLLPLIKPLFKPEHWPIVTGVVALVIIVLRNWHQPALHQNEPPEERS